MDIIPASKSLRHMFCPSCASGDMVAGQSQEGIAWGECLECGWQRSFGRAPASRAVLALMVVPSAAALRAAELRAQSR